MLTDPSLTTTNLSMTFPGITSWGAAVAFGDIGDRELEMFPYVVSRAQAYYWSHLWQAGENAALRDITAGETMRFDDPQDALRWLLEVDEDELADDDDPDPA